MKALSVSRPVQVLLFVILAFGLVALVLPRTEFYREWRFEGKAKIREGGVRAEVLSMSPENKIALAPPAPSGFTPQTRMGFPVDNEWEPSIASDRFGHVYILYPQYGGVPGCPSCYSPTMILQMSSDHGQNFASPVVIYPAGSTLATRWMHRSWWILWMGKPSMPPGCRTTNPILSVAKSTDFGATWSVVTADSTNAGTDKPILAVRGQDVYVVYNHSQTIWGSYSHDGGTTFTSVKVNQNAKLGWSLAGGGTVTPDGKVYFSWAGYEDNGGAKGNVNLYISKSTDGGSYLDNQST